MLPSSGMKRSDELSESVGLPPPKRSRFQQISLSNGQNENKVNAVAANIDSHYNGEQDNCNENQMNLNNFGNESDSNADGRLATPPFAPVNIANVPIITNVEPFIERLNDCKKQIDSQSQWLLDDSAVKDEQNDKNGLNLNGLNGHGDNKIVTTMTDYVSVYQTIEQLTNTLNKEIINLSNELNESKNLLESLQCSKKEYNNKMIVKINELTNEKSLINDQLSKCKSRIKELEKQLEIEKKQKSTLKKKIKKVNVSINDTQNEWDNKIETINNDIGCEKSKIEKCQIWIPVDSNLKLGHTSDNSASDIEFDKNENENEKGNGNSKDKKKKKRKKSNKHKLKSNNSSDESDNSNNNSNSSNKNNENKKVTYLGYETQLQMKKLSKWVKQKYKKLTNEWNKWDAENTSQFLKFAIIKELKNNQDGIDNDDINIDNYLKCIENHKNCLIGNDLITLNETTLKVFGIEHQSVRQKIVMFVKKMIFANDDDDGDDSDNDDNKLYSFYQNNCNNNDSESDESDNTGNNNNNGINSNESNNNDGSNSSNSSNSSIGNRNNNEEESDSDVEILSYRINNNQNSSNNNNNNNNGNNNNNIRFGNNGFSDNSINIENGYTCVVCVLRKVDMVYNTCGHLCLCEICYNEWSKTNPCCPQCRAKNNGARKVYITGFDI